MVRDRFGSLSPVRQLRDEMDRLFSDFFSPAASAAQTQLYPALNVWETEDKLFCEAELPGVRKEDLDLTVVGGELTIRGQRAEQAPENAVFHRRERGTAAFSRVLRLPTDVDAGGVEATLKDGVLLIALPKAEAARPRKIKVASGG